MAADRPYIDPPTNSTRYCSRWPRVSLTSGSFAKLGLLYLTGAYVARRTCVCVFIMKYKKYSIVIQLVGLLSPRKYEQA